MFPDELYQAPRSWAERVYPDNLIYFNELDRGGHFAVWEQPQLFSEEMHAGLRAAAQTAKIGAATVTDEDFRMMQNEFLALPCSIIFGKGVGSAAAGSAHGLHLIVSHEARIDHADPDWLDWYAEYMVRGQAGEGLPS